MSLEGGVGAVYAVLFRFFMKIKALPVLLSEVLFSVFFVCVFLFAEKCFRFIW